MRVKFDWAHSRAADCLRGLWGSKRSTTPRTGLLATIWNEPPELALPSDPAILSGCSALWLAYETIAEPRGQSFAVVRFRGVIDHRLSPINDEGLGEHPYLAAGLRWYSFNELKNSQEVVRWSALRVRHWVVTFKDVTLDVVAKESEIVARDLRAGSALAALLSVIESGETSFDDGVDNAVND